MAFQNVNIAQSAGQPSFGALSSTQSSSQLLRTSNGNLYAVLLTADLRVGVFKSTNNGNTWSKQKYINSPTYTVFSGFRGLSAAIDSTDIIHIVYTQTPPNLTGVRYIQYSTSTDTFGPVNTFSSR